MARDPQIIAHQEWLGYVQPVGLVVSIPALIHAQANLDRNIISQHQRMVALIANETDADYLGFSGLHTNGS